MLDRIIRFSLEHRLLVVCLFALLTVYGAFVISRLPVDVFPDLNRPTVTIMTEIPGRAPEEVETLVTLPLETVLNGLPGVQRLRSSSGIGLSVVYVEFEWGSEIFRNRQLVTEKLSQVRERLPDGATPVMGPISSIMGQIQLIGLHSPDGSVSPMDLRTIADWSIRPQLLSVSGVSQVISIGGGIKQYQILISAEKLKRFQLTLEDVHKNLQLVSANTTGGFLDLNDKEYLIRNLGTVKSIEDIQTSVVGLHFGRPVLVKDIAEVRVGHQVKRGDGSLNGKPAVILSVEKQPGANTVELTKRVDAALVEISKSLPKGVALEADLFRQSHFIESAIDNVRIAMRDGVILVIVILFIFLLNLRTTAITLTAIPLSFVMTAVILNWFGISVNTMTLGGLAVAIGELVDDAIVDVENVFRRLSENRKAGNKLSSLRVIYDASREVRNSIVLATIIVVMVFIPLFFLDGVEGRLFVPLGIAYVVSILASLVVSLTLTPVLCSYLLPNSKLAEKGDAALVRLLKSWDRRALNWALDKPKTLITIVIILFAGAIVSIPFMGKDFLPKFNEGTAMVSLIAQPGVSLEASNKLGTQAEELILQVPEVKSVSRRTGRAELDEHAEGVNSSEIDIDFRKDGRAREIVLKDIREKLATLKDVSVNIGQPISHRLDHMLSGVQAAVAIKVFGPELQILRRKAAEIETALTGTPGLVDLNVEKQVLTPQVKIQLLREEAAKYGIILGELSQTLETALNGEIVSQVIEGQKLFNVFMRFDDHSRGDPELIKQALIKIMPDGERVTLNQIADIYEASGPNIVNRENSVRRIVVSANVANRDLDSLIKEVKSRISKDVEIPEGYFVSFDGQFKSQQQASRIISLLGLLALVGIFLVLYANFKSAFISIQIMLNIPMALIGSVFAVFLSTGVFSVATLVGFITLCGIASRNGIMMISHYLHLMKSEGESFSREMVIRGSLERLVPVLMTALTAALALVPFALSHGMPGREILAPLAVVILGGLLTSTLLDMLLTPTVFYNYGKSSALKSLESERKLHELKS